MERADHELFAKVSVGDRQPAPPAPGSPRADQVARPAVVRPRPKRYGDFDGMVLEAGVTRISANMARTSFAADRRRQAADVFSLLTPLRLGVWPMPSLWATERIARLPISRRFSFGSSSGQSSLTTIASFAWITTMAGGIRGAA